MAQASLVEWLHFAGARDETGEPVASGFAYFYVPHSTSSLISVYSDDIQTPLAQPVQLDAAGRAEVYLKDPCEIIIKDSLGATKRLSVFAERMVSSQISVVDAVASWNWLSDALAAIKVFMDAAAAVVPSESWSAQTLSGTNPAFEFDPTRTLNVMKTTYAGALGTPTVAWPSPAPTLVKGTRYRIIFQNGSGTATTITFAAQFIHSWGQIGSPSTMAANTYYTAEFQVDSAQTGLFQVSPWFTYGGNPW